MCFRREYHVQNRLALCFSDLLIPLNGCCLFFSVHLLLDAFATILCNGSDISFSDIFRWQQNPGQSENFPRMTQILRAYYGAKSQIATSSTTSRFRGFDLFFLIKRSDHDPCRREDLVDRARQIFFLQACADVYLSRAPRSS